MRLNVSTLALALMAFLALSVQNTEAFVKGSVTTRARPSSTELYAAAKKAAKKKKAKKKSTKSAVETLRKAELVAEVAEKLGSTKTGAEEALAAVLDTISEVRTHHGSIGNGRF